MSSTKTPSTPRDKNTCTTDWIQSDISFTKIDESTRESSEPSRVKRNQESETFIQNALQLQSPKS